MIHLKSIVLRHTTLHILGEEAIHDLRRKHDDEHVQWEAERDALHESIEVRSSLQRTFGAKTFLRYTHNRWANVHVRPALHKWRAMTIRSANAVKIMHRWMLMNDRALAKRVMQTWQRCTRAQSTTRRILTAVSARSQGRTLRGRFWTWVIACRAMERATSLGQAADRHESMHASAMMQLR